MKAVVAATEGQAGALVAALSASGVEAELIAASAAAGGTAAAALAEALVSIEARLERERPDAAVTVGTGDAPLALALVAAKLGVPLAACLPEDGGEADSIEAAERRILGVLAGERIELGGGDEAAAERLLAWLEATA